MIADPHSNLEIAANSRPTLSTAEKTDTKRRPSMDNGFHRLQNDWTFFYKTAKSRSKNYAKAINIAFSFNSIEHFWNYYSNICTLPINSKCEDYFLFRSNFRPEVEHIPHGCRHIIELYQYDRQLISNIWEKLIMMLIGDFLANDTDYVNGINLNPKNSNFRLILWYNSANQTAANDRITQKILKATGISKVDIKVDSNEEASLRYIRDSYKYRNDDYSRQNSKGGGNPRFENKRNNNNNNQDSNYNGPNQNKRYNDKRSQTGGGTGGGYNNNNNYRHNR